MSYESKKRPIIKTSLSTIDKIAELISFIVLLVVIVLSIYYWTKLPSRIPSHYNFVGQPDSYGGKGGSVFIPVVSIFLYTLLSVLSKFPHIFNYVIEITSENAERQYKNARSMMVWMKLETTSLFTCIQLSIMRAASGESAGLSLWFLPVMLVVIFGTIAYYVRKSLKLI